MTDHTIATNAFAMKNCDNLDRTAPMKTDLITQNSDE
jgi:hypothetical protein